MQEFDDGVHPISFNSHSLLVTTLQGRLVTSLCEALERSPGMTLSHMDLVLSVRVRSVQQRKVVPSVA